MSAFGDWEVNGWRIRITQGRKHPDDRRIWVAGPDGTYCLLSLAALGAITRLWYRNEDVLYPPEFHRGGEKVLEFLRECCESDLTTACRLHGLKPPTITRLDDVQPYEEAA